MVRIFLLLCALTLCVAPPAKAGVWDTQDGPDVLASAHVWDVIPAVSRRRIEVTPVVPLQTAPIPVYAPQPYQYQNYYSWPGGWGGRRYSRSVCGPGGCR